MVVAFLYIGLLQIPFLVSFLVWSCVLLILVALVVLAIGLWVTAGEWDDEGTKDDVSDRTYPGIYERVGHLQLFFSTCVARGLCVRWIGWTITTD